MVTDFPDYQEKYGVTPATIREQAEEPGIGANEVAVLAGDLQGDSARVSATIEGAPADGTITAVVNQGAEARALAADGLYAVALIKEFAGKAETFDTEVEAINTLLHQRIISARSRARQDAEPGEDPAPVDASAIKADLQPRYNTAEEALETAADNAQTAFTNAEAGGPSAAEVRRLMVAGLISLDALPIFPGVTLTDDQRVTAIRNELSFMSPEEQAEYVRTHTDLPPEAADAIVPEAQEILASQVADDIKGTTDRDIEIDAETVRLLAFLQNQEPFANALYENVTPDEMGEAIKTLNYNLFGVGDDRDRDEFPGNGQAQLDIYDKFMNAAGVALATYSRNHTDQEELADTWSSAITDGDNPENAAALTLLMREGGESGGEFGATFIDHVASDLYNWERSHGGDPVWGPKAQEAGIWIRDPDRVSISEWHDQYYDQDKYNFNGGMMTDGLANVLAAMGDSPEGAQRFFMNSDGTVDEGRLNYLMLDRNWNPGEVNSDNGDGLGEALQAATVGGVPGESGDFTQSEADALTNEVFRTIADKSGSGDDWDPIPGAAGDDLWHPWSEMTDSLGAIASGYTDDVYDLLSNNPAERLDLTPEQLEKVLGEIGSSDDRTGLETLTAAMLIECNQETNGHLAGLNGEHTIDALNGAGLEGVQQTNGNVMGLLLDHGLSIKFEDEQLDAARREFLAKGLDIASGFIPGLPAGATDLATNSYDALKGLALEQLQSAVKDAPTSDGYLDSVTGPISDKIQYGAITELMRNGYLDPQDTVHHGHFAGFPQELTVGDPPQVRPELYDSDGYEIGDATLARELYGNDVDTDNLTHSQQREIEQHRGNIEDAWERWQESPLRDTVMDLTHQTTFWTHFIDPSLAGG